VATTDAPQDLERMEADWIAADWGTSSLRLWALNAAGETIAHASSSDGMGRLSREDYEGCLLREATAWLPQESGRRVPVIVCGMAGARQGWREAAYRAVPCPPVAAAGLTRVETADRRLEVHIIPGLCQAEPPDVMRGEETQLAGLIAGGMTEGTVCLPGTHSKWVRLEAGEVSSFRTFMTGELFSVIGEHSILRHSLAESPEAFDQPAFLEAVRETLAGPQNLTAALFSIRARGLLMEGAGAGSRERLSGHLIGAELAACRPLWESGAVHLLGSGPLATLYALALEHSGAAPVVEDAESLTLAGLAQAHRSMKEDRR
jgi:2-dehydro-3-deoxygalactonokinase